MLKIAILYCKMKILLKEKKMRERVVITGMSTLNPLGSDLDSSFKALVEGKSGIAPITLFDCSDFDSKIAGEVKNFNPEDYMPIKQAKRMDRFVQLSVAASTMLFPHAKFEITDENAEDVGAILGVGLGGLGTIETFHNKLLNSGPSKVSPFYIPMLISNMATGQISIFTGAKNTNLVMTSACASATHAIGYAASEIMLGRAKAIITGGVESTITPMGISGFTALKALSTQYNDQPELASRPFDGKRDGFVMGEGAGLLLLESLSSAKERGATIYAEVAGFGASCDAYHMTAPHESGSGMAQAMRAAVKDAGIKLEDITCMNAHGTSTPLNDRTETKAIKDLFGDHAYNIAISANKSQVGHLLGAAGAVEAIFSTMSLYTGMVPGTINNTNPDPECDLNYMSNGSKQLNPEYVLSTSYGFGGTNAGLVLKKYSE